MSAIEQQAAQIQQEAMQSIFNQELKPRQIAEMLALYPYLQIVNGRMDYDALKPVERVSAESGWSISDFGEALTTSCPLFQSKSHDVLFMDEDDMDEDEQGGTGGGEGEQGSEDEEEEYETYQGPIVKEGVGTVKAQAHNTALEMIAMAAERGWEGVVMVGGDDLMKRSAWIGCELHSLSYGGYTADDSSWKQFDRIVHLSAVQVEKILAAIAHKKPAKGKSVKGSSAKGSSQSASASTSTAASEPTSTAASESASASTSASS